MKKDSSKTTRTSATKAPAKKKTPATKAKASKTTKVTKTAKTKTANPATKAAAAKPATRAAAAKPATSKKTTRKPVAPKVVRAEAPAISHEEIARRAYEIFEQRGYNHGGDVDDWLAAERELNGR